MKTLKSFLKDFVNGKRGLSVTSSAKNAGTKMGACIGTRSFIVTLHVSDEQLMAAGLSDTAIRDWLDQLVWEGISRNTWLNKIAYVRLSTTAIATKLPFVCSPSSESELNDLLRTGRVMISPREYLSTSSDHQG